MNPVPYIIAPITASFVGPNLGRFIPLQAAEIPRNRILALKTQATPEFDHPYASTMGF